MDPLAVDPQFGWPRKRKRLLPVTAAALAIATGGTGYYAWQVRAERDDASVRAATLEQKTKSLSDALELHRASTEDLDKKLVSCKADVEVQKTTAIESGARVATLEAEVTAARSQVKDLSAQQKEAAERLAEFQSISRMFQRMIDAGKLEVQFRRGELVVKLPEAILFPSGSARLSTDGQQALGEVGRILRKLSERRFTIAGHSDDVPIRNAQFHSNWELSSARAVAVTEFLIRNGVRSRNLVAAGYGEFAPIASNNTKLGRARNRRIEIVLEPLLSRSAVRKATQAAHAGTAKARPAAKAKPAAKAGAAARR